MKHTIILILLSFVVYSNIFHNEFVWDDIDQIVRNDAIKDWGYVPQYFTTDLWQMTSRRDASGYYRPFFLLTLLVQYKIFGLQPWGYHLVSIMLHATCAVLLYFLLMTCFKERRVAFMASVFFVVCTLSSEAVRFISAQCHPLGLVFFLLTLLLFYKHNKTASGRAVAGVVSVFTCLFALFSKEMTITLPAILLLYDYFFVSRPAAENVFRWFSSRLKYHLPYIAVTVVYLISRFSVMGGVRLGTAALGTTFIPDLYPSVLATNFISDLYLRALTAVTAYVHYITRIIFPVGLSAVYNFEVPKSPADLKFIVSAFLLFVIMFFLVRGRKEKVLLFGALWFFVSLLPASNIIPIPVLVADRYAYIPSVGFCVVAGFLLSKLDNSWILRLSGVLRTIPLFIYIALILFQGASTFRKNSTWKTAESLWTHTLSIFPTSAIAWNNLGSAYSEDGKLDDAISAYEKAILHNPAFVEPHTNLAGVYKQKGMTDQAIVLYERAIAKPGYVSANVRNNLGLLYEQKGDSARAVEEYKQAINIDRRFWQAYNNLGKMYALMKRYEEAISEFQKAMTFAPRNVSEPHLNLGGVYVEIGHYDMAVAYLQRALEIDPDSREALINLGVAYARKGETEKAKDIFNRLSGTR